MSGFHTETPTPRQKASVVVPDPSVLDWSEITVGDTLGPYIYDVSAEVVRQFRDAVDDHELLHVSGEEVAPPALLTFPFLQLIETWRAPRSGTVHASQEFEFLAAVRVGARLTVTGVLVGMYLRRNRRLFQVDAKAVDERGVEVARSVTLGVYPDVDVPTKP